MRLQEIVGLIRENLFLGIFGVFVLGVIGAIGYFFIYRKLLAGKKKFTLRELLIGTALIGYIIIVIGATLLNRGENYPGSVNLQFLSSYREAWNTFSIRNWQFLILNILMFVPLGILLPLMYERFRQFKWTIGIAFIFTLFIECTQLFTASGIFELDDLFHNVIGAFIGYGVIMAVLTVCNSGRNNILKVVAYLSPVILVTTFFISIFQYYSLKEFGNLSIAYDYKIKMKDAEIRINQDLHSGVVQAPIYKASGYNKASAQKFVSHFFENQGINTDHLEITDYYDNALYSSRADPMYSLWLYYLDGSYRYTDFSAFDENVEAVATNEEALIGELSKFDIQVPVNAKIISNDVGHYEWIVEREIVGDTLTEGTLTCDFYDDGTIKRIHNQIITYNKVRNVSLKSEMEALNELKKGKFQLNHWGNHIQSIEIKKVELDYFLDSKGYYQPVYSFESIINGTESQIIIPAMN